MRHLMVTDSDIVESIGYDPKGGTVSGALELVFKSTPRIVYRYPDVTEKEFVQLVTSESIGKAVHDMFRKTKRPFTKSERPTLKK